MYGLDSFTEDNEGNNKRVNDGISKGRRIRWEDSKKDVFVHNIELNDVNSIINEVDNLSVQQITCKLNEIMIKSAKQTFIEVDVKSNSKQRPRKKSKYPSYNAECKNKRQQYHKAKHKNNRHSCKENHDEMIRRSKDYKKAVQKAKRESTKDLIEKLRNLKSRNSKEYWKLLRSTHNSDIPILIDEFFTHFKELAQDNENVYNGDVGMNTNIPTYDTTQLNGPFTELEISKCIGKLRKGKSAGSDDILNEYIKSTEEIMMPLYVKLFNKIMDEGIIPE